MWGGVKNPSPTLPLSAAITNCSNFKFLKGSPQPFFDFYGDLFWGTLYLVWRGDVFVQCTKRSNFNQSQSWGFEEGWREIESFVLLKDFMGNHLHKRCI